MANALQFLKNVFNSSYIGTYTKSGQSFSMNKTSVIIPYASESLCITMRSKIEYVLV